MSSRLGTPDTTGRGLFSLFATWLPGGATLSRPYIGCTPAPHRTGQALSHIRLFTQTFARGLNGFIWTRIRGVGQPVCRKAWLKQSSSMQSEAPAARAPLSYDANSRVACSLGQNVRQSPKLFRSRGYVSDSGHTPFTSLDTHCLSISRQQFRAIGSTLPGKASSMPSAYLLLNHGSEPG